MTYRTGRSFGIHVYDGDRPVATFHDPDEAARFVAAINQADPMTDHLDQENDMTSPTQRRHDELVALLTEIRDALDPEVLARQFFERRFPDETDDFLADAPRVPGLDDPEPAGITEEPPVGSQVTDKAGDVWERREAGWALWWPERSGWIADLHKGAFDLWPVVRDQAPLRFTTDEDRERVGLPVEPAPDVDPDGPLAGEFYFTWESTGDNRLGQPTGRWVGPIEVGEP